MSTPHVVRTLREEDLPQLAALLGLAFGGGADEVDHARFRPQLPVTRGVFRGPTLLATARMFPFEAFVAGARTAVGGLAAVATAPEARRRGLAAELVVDGLRGLRERGVGWCTEHPFDPAFYARYGFQSVPNGTVVELPTRALGGRPVPEAERLEGEERGRVRTVHASYARRFHFALTRDDGARDGWGRVWSPVWAPPSRTVYLLEDAYLVLSVRDVEHPDGSAAARVDVRDFGYATPQGRTRLLAFLGAFDGHAGTVRLHLPPGDPLLADRGGAGARPTHVVQARIVDLPVALAPFASEVEREIVIGVRDDVCPWNDGTFRLALGARGTRVEATDAEPSAVLDVRALTRLLSGGASAHAVLADGGAEGDASTLRALEALAGGRTSFVTRADHF